MIGRNRSPSDPLLAHHHPWSSAWSAASAPARARWPRRSPGAAPAWSPATPGPRGAAAAGHQGTARPPLGPTDAGRQGRGATASSGRRRVRRRRRAAGPGGDGPSVDQGRIREEVDAARTDPSVRLIVLDAAVMLEAGWHDVCDRLVYIDAPRGAAAARGRAARLDGGGGGGAGGGAAALDGEGRARRSYARQLRLSGRPRAPGGRSGAALGAGPTSPPRQAGRTFEGPIHSLDTLPLATAVRLTNNTISVSRTAATGRTALPTPHPAPAARL